MSTRSWKKRNILLSVLVVLISICFIALYLVRSKSVFHLGGSPDTPALIVFFNPFRDRGAERATDSWLKPGLAGNWSEVRAEKTSGEWSSLICGSSSTRLVQWKLKDRQEYKGQSRLAYRLRCSDTDRLLVVYVERSDSGWHVTAFAPGGEWSKLLRSDRVY